MKTIISILIFLFIHTTVFCQIERINKDKPISRKDSLVYYTPTLNIFGEFAGTGRIFSLNLEKRIFNSNSNSIYLRAHFFKINIFYDSVYTYGLMLNYTRFLNRHYFFEIGFGYSNYFNYIYVLPEMDHLYEKKRFEYYILNIGINIISNNYFLLKINLYPNFTLNHSIYDDYSMYPSNLPKKTYFNNSYFSFYGGFSLGYSLIRHKKH
jgi:hypothetical protein